MPSLMQPSAHLDSDLALRAMFAARKRVFVDLLGWQVPVIGGRFEIDQFDTPAAEYLILTGEAGEHRASTRLLRTERAHILSELFSELCEDEVPSGPTCREITRFCLDPALTACNRRTARNQLVTALAEHALRSGITDYTGVASPGWFAQIAGFGWQCRALGEPRQIGDQRLIALHIAINDQTLGDLRGGGIYLQAQAGLVRTGGLQ